MFEPESVPFRVQTTRRKENLPQFAPVKPRVRAPLCSLTLLLACASAAQQAATLDGVTFSDTDSRIYVPLREVGTSLDWRVTKSGGTWSLNGRSIPNKETRRLVNGTKLVSLSALKTRGLRVNYDPKRRLATVKNAKNMGRFFYVRNGMKRVRVNKKAQELRAWQGQRLVLVTPVSTGRAGKQTPTGIFRAQAYKNKLHRSRLYDNVAMPWSVHIVGNIFLHGFKSVPGRPASAGCIRIPLDKGNPARWLYTWIEPGTSVSILGKWPAGTRVAAR